MPVDRDRETGNEERRAQEAAERERREAEQEAENARAEWYESARGSTQRDGFEREAMRSDADINRTRAEENFMRDRDHYAREPEERPGATRRPGVDASRYIREPTAAADRFDAARTLEERRRALLDMDRTEADLRGHGDRGADTEVVNTDERWKGRNVPDGKGGHRHQYNEGLARDPNVEGRDVAATVSHERTHSDVDLKRARSGDPEIGYVGAPESPPPVRDAGDYAEYAPRYEAYASDYQAYLSHWEQISPDDLENNYVSPPKAPEAPLAPNAADYGLLEEGDPMYLHDQAEYDRAYARYTELYRGYEEGFAKYEESGSERQARDAEVTRGNTIDTQRYVRTGDGAGRSLRDQ